MTYLVQAWQKSGAQWVADSRHEDLTAAESACRTLHRDWNRKTRVVDAETGRLLLHLPPMKRRQPKTSDEE